MSDKSEAIKSVKVMTLATSAYAIIHYGEGAGVMEWKLKGGRSAAQSLREEADEYERQALDSLRRVRILRAAADVHEKDTARSLEEALKDRATRRRSNRPMEVALRASEEAGAAS